MKYLLFLIFIFPSIAIAEKNWYANGLKEEAGGSIYVAI